MTRVRSLLVVVALLASSCTYTTTARAPSRGELWIEGEEAGDASPGGSEVEVPVTYLDPTWALYLDEDEDEDASGVLARTRLEPITTASLCACAGLAVPSCGALGLLVANPTTCIVCLAPLGEVFLLSGTNALRTTPESASWGTVPVVAACALLGFAPLALLPFALRVPEEVELPLAPGDLPSSSEPSTRAPDAALAPSAAVARARPDEEVPY